MAELLVFGVFLFVHPRAFLRAADPTRGRMAGLMTDNGAGWLVILLMFSSDRLRSSMSGENGARVASAGGGEERLSETGIDCKARLLSNEEEIDTDADKSTLERWDLVLLRLGEREYWPFRGYGDSRFMEDVRDRTRRGRRSEGKGT